MHAVHNLGSRQNVPRWVAGGCGLGLEGGGLGDAVNPSLEALAKTSLFLTAPNPPPSNPSPRLRVTQWNLRDVNSSM